MLVVPIGIGGGVLAALRAGSLRDRSIVVIGQSLGIVPEFIASIVLILIFGVWLRWLPMSADWPEGAGALTQIRYLILPALPPVLIYFGYIARMARVGTIEALNADYTRTAVLKGLPWHTVLRRHVLRNALLPTINDRGQPDRLSGRRPGRDRGAVPLSRHGRPDLCGRQGQGFPDARGRRADHRRHLCPGLAAGRPGELGAQPAHPRRMAVRASEGRPRARRVDTAERASAAADTLRALLRSRTLQTGAAILLFWIVCALFGQHLTPRDPYADDLLATLSPPSLQHWFGTDQLGRDVFSRVIIGARDILIVAPLATLLGTVLGTILGLVIGYFRGPLDDVVSRVIEALQALPLVIVALLALAAVGTSNATVVCVIGFVFTPHHRAHRARRDAQ